MIGRGHGQGRSAIFVQAGIAESAAEPPVARTRILGGGESR